MQATDRRHERQAEPRARPRARVLKPHEPIGDAGAIFRDDADAAVGHSDLDRAGPDAAFARRRKRHAPLDDRLVAGTIRLTYAIEAIYGSDVLDFWHLEITDRAGRRVFGSTLPAGAAALDRSLLTWRHIAVADVAWKISLAPTPQLIETLRTTSPGRILAIGLVAALITGVANYLLAQRQRRLSASLRESERLTEAVETTRRHLTDLVNGIEAVIWESDAEMYRFTFVNDYARKLLGMDTEHWVAEPAFWYENVHPDDRARACGNARGAHLPGRIIPSSTGWCTRTATLCGYGKSSR